MRLCFARNEKTRIGGDCIHRKCSQKRPVNKSLFSDFYFSLWDRNSLHTFRGCDESVNASEFKVTRKESRPAS